MRELPSGLRLSKCSDDIMAADLVFIRKGNRAHKFGLGTGHAQTHHDDELEGDDEPQTSLRPKGILHCRAPSSDDCREGMRQGQHAAFTRYSMLFCTPDSMHAGMVPVPYLP